MPRPVPRPAVPVSADALARIMANRRIRDMAAYVAEWIRERDVVREDMMRIIELLTPLVTKLREEITADEGRGVSGPRRRMSHCSVLLATVVSTTFWLGSGKRTLLKEGTEAVRLARAAADPRAEIAALYIQGAILNHRGRINKALSTYRAAVRLGRQHGFTEAAFCSLLAIPMLLHFKLNDFPKALKAVDECTTVLEQNRDREGWAIATLELRGLIVYKLGRVEEGLNMLASAQKFAADCGYPIIELRIRNETIDILNDIGDYSSALEHARRIEELLHDIPKPVLKIALLCTTGRLLLKLNEPDDARPKLEEAYHIAVNLDNSFQRSRVADLLGRLHLVQGDAKDAEARLHEALLLAEELKEPAHRRSRILARLGQAYAAQARGSEAGDAYRAALVPANQGGQAADTAETECELGALCEKLGRPDDAAVHYSNAVTAGTAANRDEQIAPALERLASLAAERGDFRAAFDYYRRYHELRRALDARHHDNRIMALRVRYRIDHLEAAVARERGEKEHACAALHAAHAEIDAMALALIEHQQRFGALRSRLEELGGKIEQEGGMEVAGILRSIVREAGDHTGVAHARWQANLSNTNGGFRRLLRARHPALTPALELLCACIRSGLTTDSIASVLHITTAAISKRRHRLRKVLGLSTDQQLETYLAQI